MRMHGFIVWKLICMGLKVQLKSWHTFFNANILRKPEWRPTSNSVSCVRPSVRKKEAKRRIVSASVEVPSTTPVIFQSIFKVPKKCVCGQGMIWMGPKYDFFDL